MKMKLNFHDWSYYVRSMMKIRQDNDETNVEA